MFKADPNSSKPHFSMSMPPPNETGSLHMGHALFLTLQDIIARHQRQLGKDVLWLPGTDHAALPVNALMEQQLTEQGTNKHEIGREEFKKRTKEFVGNSRNQIISQMRAMGTSADWDKLRYTLDNTLNRCVNEVFFRMFNDDLIYRKYRIVNWDPKLETTVSDDEVEHKEETAPLYTLQYGPFQITTARPETKFGDKYVVMHPDDERYKQYKHDDTFEVEWLNGKVTAKVIKDEAVDMSFGTGVMTITPWHDKTDFEIAERHGLEKDQIIDFTGKLLPIAGKFSGENIEDARPKIVEKLDKLGLLIGVEDKPHNLAVNSRGKGVIEPQIMLQWFVDVNRPAVEWKGQKRSLKEVMRAVVEDGDIKIIPKRFEKIYFHWIDNLRDWCVSRQIWWGHQIPAWRKKGTDDDYVAFRNSTEAENKLGTKNIERDPDTLDTWFSSALWTWSTLIDKVYYEGDKDHEPHRRDNLESLLERSIDFDKYHPTTVMETGYDILFFWVARMILATTYTLRSAGLDEEKSLPFKTVYLHGLVRTEEGRKMSKSDPDSIIDPMEVIPEFGTDALRLALVAGTTAGTDQRVGKSKILANRNFANKLWNIARYIQETVGNNRGEPAPKSLADHWILNLLSISSEAVKKALANFKFHEAYEILYHFVWDDLADWYIEASKTEPNREVLNHVLETTLKIAHPFAPFVTETIWQNLEFEGLLAAQLWPEAADFDHTKAKQFDELKNIISEARRITVAVGVNKPTLLYAKSGLIEQNKELVKRLGRLGDVVEAAKPRGMRLVGAKNDAWLDIDPQIVKAYLANLKVAQKEQERFVKLLESRLSNKAYMQKAPDELVEQTENELRQAKKQLDTISNQLKSMS
ncbi:MAG: valyl-tRNA ligase [Candidatus Saccharibacteria bacterium GW2011_GWA2_46_10]|nr:MAG: valyl-tRNA ligase [Candidatus Saccharibacteria bacterium GW2011_GWA2_46_10]